MIEGEKCAEDESSRRYRGPAGDVLAKEGDWLALHGLGGGEQSHSRL
jgi:hypothetical protein